MKDIPTQIKLRALLPQIKTLEAKKNKVEHDKDTLLKDPNKFPSLPTQSSPKEGHFFEELSDLFEYTKKVGKNDREAL